MSVATILEVTDLFAAYGRTAALHGVTFSIQPGQVVALLGANGAGKTTTLRAISGLVRTKAGAIRYDGTDLADVAPYRRVGAGIAHVPEGRRIFADLTVRENLDLGAYSFRSTGRDQLDFVLSLFPDLEARLGQAGGSLSGGQQQMLAIGRALMGQPRLLMLDEPSLGLAPVVVSTIFRVIDDIRRAGTTVLLVEQNSRIALEHSDAAYVLELGRVVHGGPSKELAADERVREAYLGA